MLLENTWQVRGQPVQAGILWISFIIMGDQTYEVWTEARVREMGHQSYSTEPQTPNLLLLKSSNSDKYKDRDRRLVLYYPFLTSKPKHIRKYASLMTTLGIDVLVVKSSLHQILHPETGSQVIGDHVKVFLNKTLVKYDSVMVFACSIGCYLFSETAIKINAQAELKSKFQLKLKAQVWECPISAGEGAIGVAKSVASNKLLQTVITTLTRLYLKVYCKSKTQHYIRAFDFSNDNPFVAPSLVMCSTADPISPPPLSESCVRRIQKKGVDTKLKVFTGVPHCQNLNFYPVEYKETFYRFLFSAGMIAEEDLRGVLQS